MKTINVNISRALLYVLFLFFTPNNIHAHGSYLADGIISALIFVTILSLFVIILLHLNIRSIHLLRKSKNDLKLINKCKLWSFINIIIAFILLSILIIFINQSFDFIKLLFIIIPEFTVSFTGLFYSLRKK